MAFNQGNSGASTLFDDDDEETQYLLANLSLNENISSRLDGLSKRFKEDHDNLQLDEQFKSWVLETKNVGFRLDESTKGGASAATSTSTSLPEAFDTEEGKKHLVACSSLLDLKSDHQAVQLTLSALRYLKDSKNLQALLGTRRLMFMVMEYYYKQRAARISVICELLRQEQDEGGSFAATSAKVLGELDEYYSIDGNDRGLFKFLLSIACRKVDSQSPIGREQMSKSRGLTAATPSTLRASVNRVSEDYSWHQFAERCMKSTRNSIHEERIRALEALTAYLYTRVQGGVRRVDYYLILKAFNSADAFFTFSKEDEKLSMLAGLICAECMGLWRACVSVEESIESEWVQGHPLLQGLLSSNPRTAETELDALKTYLLQLPDQNRAIYHQSKMEEIRRSAPESLALLSFGLLMMMAHTNILDATEHGSNPNGFFQDFYQQGQNIVMSASADLCVFDVFHSTMLSLLMDPPQNPSDRRRSDLPYDWLLFGMTSKSTPMEISDDADSEAMDMDGASLIYGSIGVELVTSLIVAFGDSILAPEHNSMQENLIMICDFAASIYRSSPSLCQRFWLEWEQETSPSSEKQSRRPLCEILDLSFTIANKTVEAGRLADKEIVLSSAAPPMQLLASWCYSAATIEAAFDILNPTILRHALAFCQEDALNESEIFKQNRLRFLSSLANMTRVGCSNSCRNKIRDVLGISTPSLLFKVIQSSDSRCSELALKIAANLLQKAPVEWTLPFARGMQSLVDQNLFEQSEALFPIACIFNAMAMSIPHVIVCERISDNDADLFLELLWRGVLRLSKELPRCLSHISSESVPLKTVTGILDFLLSLLENLASTVTSRKANQALELRSALVELLSTHLGEAIMFYALQPLSLSIACSVESYAEERSILQSAYMQESNLSGKYGVWHGTVTSGSSSLTKQSETQAQVNELVANTDFNVVKAAEFGEEFNEVIVVVAKAMGLLRLWAINAEEIAKSEVDTLQRLERLYSLSPQKLLFLTAALPNPMRAKADVKTLYESASPSNFQLLMKYIKSEMWPFNLSVLALDFLHACITHMKSNSSQAGTLKEAVQRSDFFGLLLPADAPATSSDEGEETRISSILKFRLASATLGALPSVDSISGNAASKILNAAFTGTERVANKLYSFRETKQRLSLRSELLDDLLHGTAYLSFLSSVWDDADRLEEALKLTDQYDNGAFTALVKVLLQHAHSESEIEPTASGCLCSFLAGAVNFLKVATELALTKEQTKTSTVLGMMKENSLPLISMPQKFLTVAIASTPATSKDVVALSGSPQTLLSQFPIVAVSGDTFGFFNVDVTSLAMSLTIPKETLLTLALSQYNFTSQVNLQSRFKGFADVLLQLSKPSQPSSSPGVFGKAALVQQNHNEKYLLAAREVLGVLADNVTRVESAALDEGAVMTISDIARMCESTGTVIVLLSAAKVSDEQQPNPGALTELLRLIGFSATKLQNILEANSDVCCRVEQNLLTAACLILMSQPPVSIPSEVIEKLVQVVHHMLLQLLEMKAAEGNTECLKTIVVLLTLLLEGGTDFVDGKIVTLLVRHANAYSLAGRSGQIEEEKMLESIVDIIDFFHASMESPSEKMLELISNGALQQLLTRNPIIDSAGRKWGFPDADALSTNAKLRGYIPESHIGMQSAKSTSFVSGRSDPQHALWRSALRCFREFCRVSSTKERYQSLVSDFIIAHHQMMLACLKTIESTAFTHNTIQEATHILSLLSEYCSRSGPHRDGRTLELISSYFVLESTKLVARLANFLGASSASRELFNSMGDSDSGSEDQLDLAARLSPFNRAPHNARHEAIRYSHYASRFCTAVTRDEISSAKGTGPDDLRDQSATALEKHGKAMMNSDFARRMELSAAECLFATLSLLWELHPGKSSFVMFNKSSIPFALIKEGMVIAFCSDQESNRQWNLQYVHFAEVVAVNTIDRAWYVRSLETGEGEIVKANQIVGMEDTSKRRCVLRFASAADSATELENDSHSMSIGHLILALRWCSSSPGCSTVRRLAGLASCFLGAEMEMHKLIGSSLSKTREPEFLERLYSQLLDLYGDSQESGSRGRLKGILDQNSWATICKQLRNELETAEKNRDSMVVEDEGLFLRNSGSGNPFHALRMAY